MDPRHNARVKIVQELFSLGFAKQNKLDAKTTLIVKNQQTIEEAIKKHAPKFPIDKIAKVDLAILSLAVYELIIEKKEPPKL